MIRFLVVLLAAGVSFPLFANTMPYELKAYDFCRGYHFTETGIEIVTAQGEFLWLNGKNVTGTVRLAPGDVFYRLDPDNKTYDKYTFLELTPRPRRAYFHEDRYSYNHVTWTAKRNLSLGPILQKEDFFLPEDQSTTTFSKIFPNIELHPGNKTWKSVKN